MEGRAKLLLPIWRRLHVKQLVFEALVVKKLLPTDLAKWVVKKYIDRPVERNPNYKIETDMFNNYTAYITISFVILFVILLGFILGIIFGFAFSFWF